MEPVKPFAFPSHLGGKGGLAGLGEGVVLSDDFSPQEFPAS
jgi:hypothetical protein